MKKHGDEKNLLFHFIIVVWGKEYTDTFINIVVPNLLSPGNLPAFYGQNAIFKIYTTETDAEVITHSSSFRKLSDIMVTKIEPVISNDQITQYTTYVLMSYCHKLAIESANTESAALIFLSPDAIFSDGTFSNVLKIAYRGKRLIMIAGLRVIKETFVPFILQRYYSKHNEIIKIESRDLIRHAMDHLHPLSRTLFWDSTYFATVPAHLYFKVHNQGILARCFYLHPLFINYYSKLTFQGQTIDGDFLANIHLDEDNIHIVEDSDEIISVEISNESYNKGAIRLNRSSIVKVANWARYNSNCQHRSFFQHKIYLHIGKIDSEWNHVEKYSDIIVKLIYLWLKYGQKPVILKMYALICRLIPRVVKDSIPRVVKDSIKKFI